MSEATTKIVLQHVGKSLATGRDLEPPEFVIDGNTTIQLPSAEEQKTGFSLETNEETLRVARLFPTMFKQVVKKDGSGVNIFPLTHIPTTDETGKEEQEDTNSSEGV